MLLANGEDSALEGSSSICCLSRPNYADDLHAVDDDDDEDETEEQPQEQTKTLSGKLMPYVDD